MSEVREVRIAASRHLSALKKMEHAKTIENCRFCGSPQKTMYLNLGEMPLVNNLSSSPDEEVERYPLRVFLCHDCGMSFIDCVVDPEYLFRTYCYRSGMSGTFVRHCRELARQIDAKGRFVIEIASNDGTFLHQMAKSRRLGIEPAQNLAELSQAEGITVIPEFFTAETAEKVLKEYGWADYIVAMNVFAHVHDVTGFISNAKKLLKKDGVLIIEAPWVRDTVNNNDSGQIYHEHLSYISIRGMKKFLRRMDMSIYQIKYFPDMHGGSLRFYLKQGEQQKIDVGLDDGIICYDTYQQRIDRVRDDLSAYLKDEKIVGVGAAAKGCILCNYCHLENNVLAIYDNTPEKWGKYQPGTKIPILPQEEISSVRERILILPHNFKNEIRRNIRKLNPQARFIVAVPTIEEL
ncbi:Methyltransferase domain protein [Desulfobacca acetoxidans DSM 11109]|uniref:Methyltransferase domain protein n=2 Tax=Desulfobacca acetoxidans TaxID=60893 RepID=F2NJQ7_DESAR|nr:Methyltransferase domain protein [Desulfobacca acetoxidans DSM 11109]